MKHLNMVTKSLLGIVVLLLLVGVLAAPAAAASPTEESNGQEYNGLKYALKLMGLRLDAQQDHLDNARATIDLLKEFITDEKAAGYDTSVLEAALTDAQAKLDEAQDYHDTAVQILTEKAGFDDDGNVIDPQQALDTLKNARQPMQEANQTMLEARRNFREAFREYRQSKRDK